MFVQANSCVGRGVVQEREVLASCLQCRDRDRMEGRRRQYGIEQLVLLSGGEDRFLVELLCAAC